MAEVSTVRLYVLRFYFLLNFVGLGMSAWPAVLHPARLLGPVDGAAFSFWAAFSALAILGVRYPLQMLPLLFVQLSYKTVWLLAVALPLQSAGRWDANVAEMTRVFVGAIVADVLVIPWGYVFANYVKKPGDSWKFAGAHGTLTSHPRARA